MKILVASICFLFICTPFYFAPTFDFSSAHASNSGRTIASDVQDIKYFLVRKGKERPLFFKQLPEVSSVLGFHHIAKSIELYYKDVLASVEKSHPIFRQLSSKAQIISFPEFNSLLENLKDSDPETYAKVSKIRMVKFNVLGQKS